MVKLVIILALFSAAFAGDKCRAFAFGGAGDRGSYQVGVLKGLIESLPPEETQYDVVTGISTGSINAIAMAHFAKGNETQFVDWASDWWTNDWSHKHIWDEWWLGALEGLISKPGIYDNAPTTETINNLLKGWPEGFKRTMVIGATNLVNGKFVTFNNTASPDWGDAVAAATAIGGVFPPRKMNGQVLIDGTVKYAVNLFDAITICQDMGFETKDIIIDVALTSGKSIQKVDAKDYKTLHVLARYLEITSYDSTRRIVNNTRRWSPVVIGTPTAVGTRVLQDHNNGWAPVAVEPR